MPQTECDEPTALVHCSLPLAVTKHPVIPTAETHKTFRYVRQGIESNTSLHIPRCPFREANPPFSPSCRVHERLKCNYMLCWTWDTNEVAVVFVINLLALDKLRMCSWVAGNRCLKENKTFFFRSPLNCCSEWTSKQNGIARSARIGPRDSRRELSDSNALPHSQIFHAHGTGMRDQSSVTDAAERVMRSWTLQQHRFLRGQ